MLYFSLMAWKTCFGQKNAVRKGNIRCQVLSRSLSMKPCMLNSDPGWATSGLLHHGSLHTTETMSFLSRSLQMAHTYWCCPHKAAVKAVEIQKAPCNLHRGKLEHRGVRSTSEWLRWSFWIAEIFVNTCVTTLWFYQNYSWVFLFLTGTEVKK